MPRKRQNPRMTERMLEHQQLCSSPSIAEAYPEVVSVGIELEYFDSETGKLTNKITHTIPNSAKTYYKISCPCRECVGGGFDISSALSTMLRAKSPSHSGESTCHGWQDQERISKNHCYTKIRYTLSAVYIA